MNGPQRSEQRSLIQIASSSPSLFGGRRSQFCLPRIREKKTRQLFLFTGASAYLMALLCVSGKRRGEQFTQPMAVISSSRLRERSRRDRKRACLLVELWRKLAPYPYPIANIIWLLFTRVFFCRPPISPAIHPSILLIRRRRLRDVARSQTAKLWLQ